MSESDTQSTEQVHDIGHGEVSPCYWPSPCLMCVENDTPPRPIINLPGMWEEADLSGGWADSSDTHTRPGDRT